MNPETFRWFIREMQNEVLFWFTIYCFWVDAPIMKWFMLGLTILHAIGLVHLHKKSGIKECE